MKSLNEYIMNKKKRVNQIWMKFHTVWQHLFMFLIYFVYLYNLLTTLPIKTLVAQHFHDPTIDDCHYDTGETQNANETDIEYKMRYFIFTIS